MAKFGWFRERFRIKESKWNWQNIKKATKVHHWYCTPHSMWYVDSQSLRSGPLSLIITLIIGAYFIWENKKSVGPYFKYWYFDLIFFVLPVSFVSPSSYHELVISVCPAHGAETDSFGSMGRLRGYSTLYSIHLGELNRINQTLLVLVNMETQYFYIFQWQGHLCQPRNSILGTCSQQARQPRREHWIFFLF